MAPGPCGIPEGCLQVEHGTCDVLRDTPELAAAIITGIGLPNSRGLSPVTGDIQYGSDALNTADTRRARLTRDRQLRDKAAWAN
ncbi:hypothetical protein GCM10012280_66990 [Wenjunlia tyrosinilytica]|uniref:Uncharacterized protein n=1 Tax=Wenjunlia tyrosinilytica TaxID=1544741 RepID=A0A917ZXL9_9ACTN|nr:hypothetical protein GCM10012280_66990 [Wenjunlia tyrosinilytica]